VLRAGGHKAEDVEDLRTWLSQLSGGPRITETVVLACGHHGDDRPTWHYVEADPRTGVAKRRCLACGFAVSLLDSGSRWTFPPVWSCPTCRHCIAEVAAGLSVPDGDHVRWVVLAARCVECGDTAGLTDMVLDDRPLASVLVSL